MQPTGLTWPQTAWIAFPTDFLGWLGIVGASLLLFFYLLSWKKVILREVTSRWKLVILFVVSIPLLIVLGGINLSPIDYGMMGSDPASLIRPIILIFAAIPLMFAAGIMGVIPAILLGFLTGFLSALWITHNPFTIIEYWAAASIVSIHINQNYQSRYYRIFRHPFFAALITCFYLLPILVLTTFFAIPGQLSMRLDYALQSSPLILVGRGAELLIAGLFAELLVFIKPEYWYKPEIFELSPEQQSLEKNFLFISTRFFLFLGLGLILFTWVMAGKTARQMVSNQIAGSALLVSETIPTFLQTGQDFLNAESNNGIILRSTDQITQSLSEQINAIPFFDQIYVFNSLGALEAGYPDSTLVQSRILVEEEAAVRRILSGEPAMVTISQSPSESNAAFISFVASAENEDGSTGGVLLGRTDISQNPFTLPAIQALEPIRAFGGGAYILDDQNRIIYTTTESRVLSFFEEDLPLIPGHSEIITTRGEQFLRYYLPIDPQNWYIVINVPVAYTRQIASNIAVPLIILFVIASIIGVIGTKVALLSITGSLNKLGQNAGRFANGRLDEPIQSLGNDEVGRLSRAFDEMRLHLKTKMDQMNTLLAVSQRVSSRLKVEDGFAPLLDACIRAGASSARLLFTPEALIDETMESLATFRAGNETAEMEVIDPLIFQMMRNQTILAVPNTQRTRRITLPANLEFPGSILAFSISEEKEYLGTLWLGFKEPRNFVEDEVSYFHTLALEAGVSVSNHRLFTLTENGKQRLSSILTTTPDPILVIDSHGKLFLANTAATDLEGLLATAETGTPIEDAILNPEVLESLHSTINQQNPQEIVLGKDQVFLLTINEISDHQRNIGRVCILRNITHFKQLDKIKSEFVATVSHDLRIPLKMIRGYATMLQMVGELNKQQGEYAKKITDSIDEMSQLVGNLLDLERIESKAGVKNLLVDLRNVTEKVIEEISVRSRQKKIRFVQDFQISPNKEILADPVLLHQALYNLIDNAIKFSKVEGEVKIEISEIDSNILIAIKDYGTGIAPLDLPHIFETEYESSSEGEDGKEKFQRLGLKIVRSIAEKHNGKVWAESQLGKGSTFYFEFPLKQ